MGRDAENLSRPGWIQYWFNIVNQCKLRSTCYRRQVGAIIVKDNVLISMAYNGSPIGSPNCTDIGVCAKDHYNSESGKALETCRASHAEENALMFAAKYGRAVEGATVFCNWKPCSRCSIAIVQAGIARVVYEKAHPKENFAVTDYVFKNAGIICQSKLDAIKEETLDTMGTEVLNKFMGKIDMKKANMIMEDPWLNGKILDAPIETERQDLTEENS